MIGLAGEGYTLARTCTHVYFYGFIFLDLRTIFIVHSTCQSFALAALVIGTGNVNVPHSSIKLICIDSAALGIKLLSPQQRFTFFFLQTYQRGKYQPRSPQIRHTHAACSAARVLN